MFSSMSSYKLSECPWVPLNIPITQNVLPCWTTMHMRWRRNAVDLWPLFMRHFCNTPVDVFDKVNSLLAPSSRLLDRHRDEIDAICDVCVCCESASWSQLCEQHQCPCGVNVNPAGTQVMVSIADARQKSISDLTLSASKATFVELMQTLTPQHSQCCLVYIFFILFFTSLALGIFTNEGNLIIIIIIMR